MNVSRVWRTVRHLTSEQWLYRVICRSRRGMMQAFPGVTRWRIRRAADRLPQPDPCSAPLVDIARIVLVLQIAVHGDDPAGVAEGRFTLLNRDFDFGAAGATDWRGELHEGNNPLRRMNLAYMGYAVPLLARSRAPDLAAVLDILRSLETQNPLAAKTVFRDVWNACTASHRLINLLSGLALYRAAGGTADAAAEKVLLDHARFSAAFIRANLERDLQYNHLLKNYVALAVFASATGVLPAGVGFLDAAIRTSIRQNILPDGGHAEPCSIYRALSILDLGTLSASGFFPGNACAAGQHAGTHETGAGGDEPSGRRRVAVQRSLAGRGPGDARYPRFRYGGRRQPPARHRLRSAGRGAMRLFSIAARAVPTTIPAMPMPISSRLKSRSTGAGLSSIPGCPPIR